MAEAENGSELNRIYIAANIAETDILCWNIMEPRQKAQNGLAMIYEAMTELLATHSDGLSHAEIARKLDIEMSYSGGRNYASQTILHQLVHRGTVQKIGERQSARFRLVK